MIVLGLDALVYCDCVEKGLLRKQHPFPDLLTIDETGYPDIATKMNEITLLHKQWIMSKPCIHQDFILVFERLGNVATIDFIRATISRIIEYCNIDCQIVWNKVVYSSIHSGDYLSINDVVKLDQEITQMFSIIRMDEKMHNKIIPNERDRRIYLKFFDSLKILTETSLKISKPIVF